MKAKDWNVFCDTIGKQLNFVLCLAILALINFFVASYLEDFGFPSLLSKIIKGIMALVGTYYFIYAIILTKKILDEQYKTKR
jgi:uncharacterized protein YqhQ